MRIDAPSYVSQRIGTVTYSLAADRLGHLLAITRGWIQGV